MDLVIITMDGGGFHWITQPGIIREMQENGFKLIQDKKLSATVILRGRNKGNDVYLKRTEIGLETECIPMPLPLEYTKRTRKGWVSVDA